MVATKKRRWRWAVHQQRWFGKWHVYLGVIAGAILCVVGVTGSILVFQDEIDMALNKELFESLKGQKRYTIDEIVPLVQQRYPDHSFDYVFQEENANPNTTYRFYHFKDESEFFVNPYTAEISGKRLINSSFIRIVMNIHRTLLIPAAGRYIVGLATLCMLILTISGLRLWIPQQYRKWKQWRSVLTVNFKAGFKRQNYDWHNVIGFYTAPIVILLSITGFAITFSTVFIAFLFLLTGKSPQSVAQIFDQKSVYTAGAKPLSTIQVAAVAKKILPEAELLGIAMPVEKDMSYRLDLKSASVSDAGNRILLMVDQYSGKILLNSETDFPNIGNSYLTWLTPLHYGTFGGMPTRILAFIGGLVPLILFITGFIIWWPRYKKQKKNSERPDVRPAKLNPVIQKIKLGPLPVYASFYFRKGMKYALMLLICAFFSGALYGIISGIVVQPALFAILYVGISVIVNFFIATLCIFINLLLAIFKKSSRNLLKYFLISLAFLLIFFPVCIAIALLSENIF